jgi:hypothetical protein
MVQIAEILAFSKTQSPPPETGAGLVLGASPLPGARPATILESPDFGVPALPSRHVF